MGSSFLSLPCIWTRVWSATLTQPSKLPMHMVHPHQTRFSVSPFCTNRAGKSQNDLWKRARKAIKCISLQTAKQWSAGQGEASFNPLGLSVASTTTSTHTTKDTLVFPQLLGISEPEGHPPSFLHSSWPESELPTLGTPGIHSLEGFLEKASCHHSTGR